MPCSSNIVAGDSPDPAEVMLFFELIDEDRNGTINVNQITKKLNEVECFIDSGCDYQSSKDNLKKYVNSKTEIHKQVEKYIDSINLTNQEFLTPEDFYNFIAAVYEGKGNIAK